METLKDYKQLFEAKGAEIHKEVNELLHTLSAHKPEELVAVANRISDDTLSQTEISLLSNLCWLGVAAGPVRIDSMFR